jgi:hypothetical protein
LSGVSFDSSLNFIRPNISPILIRFDLGVARTAELTSRILQPSICFAGRQNRFREPVRAAPFDSMCIQLHAFTLTPATLALRVGQQHHAPAPTPCDAHSERQCALGRCARRGISRSIFCPGGGDETGGAHPPAARAATRIQSGGAITARAAAVARAAPGAPFPVAGAGRGPRAKRYRRRRGNGRFSFSAAPRANGSRARAAA